MNEVWRDAALFGAVGVALAVAARTRVAHWLVPLGLLVAAGLVAALDMVRTSWLVGSLLHDAPWPAALLLAVWSAQGAAGWLRVRTWPLVVLCTAAFGDQLVAVGLAAAEADPARRARLVVAAGGASLVGITSGASTLMLGWGGVDVSLLGLVLALVGWTASDGSMPARMKPDARAAARAALVAVLGALTAWFVALGGTSNLVATGIEQGPLVLPGRDTPVVAGAALALGLVADEGAASLLARDVSQRGLDFGAGVTDALRVGLALAGTPTMLLATGSRLRTGLPLWLAQAALGLGFVAWAAW
jgi:hypothetical protein